MKAAERPRERHGQNRDDPRQQAQAGADAQRCRTPSAAKRARAAREPQSQPVQRVVRDRRNLTRRAEEVVRQPRRAVDEACDTTACIDDDRSFAMHDDARTGALHDDAEKRGCGILLSEAVD